MQKSPVRKLNIIVHTRQLKQQNERVLYFWSERTLRTRSEDAVSWVGEYGMSTDKVDGLKELLQVVSTPVVCITSTRFIVYDTDYDGKCRQFFRQQK